MYCVNALYGSEAFENVLKIDSQYPILCQADSNDCTSASFQEVMDVRHAAIEVRHCLHAFFTSLLYQKAVFFFFIALIVTNPLKFFFIETVGMHY